jgi:very-short-patch-repair endonuclease
MRPAFGSGVACAESSLIGGFVVDFTWPEQRLIIELDGWDAHRTRSAFEEDRARDARLALWATRSFVSPGAG